MAKAGNDPYSTAIISEMKCLKWNLNLMSKIKGRYNTPTHSTYGSMKLTISIILGNHGRSSSNVDSLIYIYT